MPVTSPPTAPSTSDPANFAARADAFVAWMAVFVAELNTIIGATIPAGSAAAGTLTGNTLAPNVTASSLTSAGALSVPSLVATTVLTLGAGSSVPLLHINGGSGTSAGPLMQFERAGVTKAYLGTDSAVMSGSSDDFTIRPAGDLRILAGSASTPNAQFAGAGFTAGAGTGVYIVHINGGSSADQGPLIQLERAGSTKAYIGTDSAVISGTSDDLSIRAGGDFRVYAGGTVTATAQFASSNFTLSTRLTTKSYTVATLPSATGAGGLIYVSNETGGAVLAFSDNTNWRRVTDRAIVA